jgi:hypothetical protein
MSALPETAAGEVDECRVNLLQSLIDEDRKKRAANAAAGGNVSACRFHRQELGNGNAFPTFRRRWLEACFEAERRKNATEKWKRSGLKM